MKEIELLKIIFKDSPDILEPLNKIDQEIERLNNIINEFNSSYSKIIKECEEMINDRYYINENAIKYHANRIRDIAKYYIEEPKWQELKGNNNGVWVNNLLEVIKENNIEFGSEKE